MPWNTAVSEVSGPAHRATTLTSLDLGPVMVHRIRAVPFVARRPRQRGPGPYQLILPVTGGAVVRQERREARLAAGDIALYDASRPFRFGTDGAPDDQVRTDRTADSVDAFLLDMPADVVPLSPAALEDVLAVRIPGYSSVAQVLAAVLGELTARQTAPPPADAVRLSTVVIELVGGVLATSPVGRPCEPADPTGTLMLRIHEYVDRHLEDPGLTPPRIAAEHHISVRRLHQLFRGQGATVSGWIRARRLDACRRDLADPSLGGRPVHAVAARWGFADESHFGRVFRSAYGVSPAAWRRAVLSRAAES